MQTSYLITIKGKITELEDKIQRQEHYMKNKLIKDNKQQHNHHSSTSTTNCVGNDQSSICILSDTSMSNNNISTCYDQENRHFNVQTATVPSASATNLKSQINKTNKQNNRLSTLRVPKSIRL